MLEGMIKFSLKNKLIILLFTFGLIGFGMYSVTQLSIGAVPDITNNQLQVITTSSTLSTQDIEQFVTYPIEIQMANLPGIKEVRSISKFGLSVVTLVFDESMGTYLPRQLVAEKIKIAAEEIPEGFGSPEIGPITTGLGEIYQYTLEVKPEFKDRYSTSDLRTIQDWIVRRQLSGIPGVVEVNTWGGHLKQYEVAINTAKLKAMNISVNELFTALEGNNSIAGGAYIEKENQSFFIRGEGKITSLDDIRAIVVKNENNLPILVNDVAVVRLGSANRFGAITGNGEGEKVLGQIMMIKNGNSKKVLTAVKDRVAEVQSRLPEGVYINPFLERSELVGKTTFTIAENLILGCLIVIFVVVLLLGNLRSGLVVASVIPLCLLFAISMMNLFDIDANLMSMGAIDFGIIIDGAVIIVEFVAFKIVSGGADLRTMTKADRQLAIDEITFKSTNKMMNSAFFGQLIILIVFIPILSLTGVEGKMFKPMAMTFSFALIGAMILCLTYVPVISSLVLKPVVEKENSFSKRLIARLISWYQPLIEWALKHTKAVLISSGLLLAIAVVLFTRMGGEFIPKLDEGDFVIQPVLKTGTSLSKTIETTTKIENILLKNFPEVDQVVTRIGAAEVPTDPMSMEETDVIIKLHPKGEWTSAATKDELADKMKAEIEKYIPNMEIEFTQPIEMRFNELISGSRADIAIKVFGEDLDVLNKMAHQIRNSIEKIPGAADIIVEKVAGLKQMSVVFDRQKIARYGLKIADVNQTIALAFAGKQVGNVFEGERKFDLVVRLDEQYKRGLDDLKSLYITIPSGQQIPLEEVAHISYTEGPAQISRENTKRRIVVGVNVRNRDLQSVIEDIQQKLGTELQMPAGYSIEYGGQFKNLQSAKDRLMIAVPIALLLIFLLLYFAFHSIQEALMVYTAIPLSAVGGVLFLWMRDLPFSISAGVGFIALFGIAVLNGIVLVEHFNELTKAGMKNIDELIIKGTTDRLRPVLLTASAAALGFLPMAISSSAGAEVQRPLATVVIGGLFTATILTMLVLPVLYKLLRQNQLKKQKTHALPTLILICLLGMGTTMSAQEPTELEQFIATAQKNNKGVLALDKKTARAKAEIKTAYSIEKTNVYYSFDENNKADNDKALRVFGVEQKISFPTVYHAKKKLVQANYSVEDAQSNWDKTKISYGVSNSYYQVIYLKNRVALLQQLDSLYQNFSYASQRKFELGETNYLEKITSQAKYQQVKVQLNQLKKELQMENLRLQALVQDPDSIEVNKSHLEWEFNIEDQAIQQQYQQLLEAKSGQWSATIKQNRQAYMPDLTLEYFQGTNKHLPQAMSGFQIGLAIPLFYGETKAQLKASKLAAEGWELERENLQIGMEQFVKNQQMEIVKAKEGMDYFKSFGKQMADELFKVGAMSYQNGAIDFFQYISSIENALALRQEYLENQLLYIQANLNLYYLNY
ncbi:CusA/CzcA family heavy metal efflux RND transporter [Flavobacterium sp. NKUCC04_CG]|uniref:CusA/CzcA family heavy metal efflux RND transporter n=1 Tax=Flavobacterium sp. NKUCC04_CG TaxID=2842121 RepID=UPI001C5AC734|nr:CusA/CzcA family heavy metal efflux RND transporter [Flavobacterium sp. NKUCC04_CG]MBW3519736.1 CusA/CzcA family heavy metal efflux RND transporter [Flavobacterium sp. NKUCC04_CG]